MAIAEINNPQLMSSQGERANWTDPTYRKYFIDLCMREANNGNRSGATLKPTAWNRISQELKTLTGKSITPKQLKNGWDYMKRQYLTWLKLTMTIGHGYNSTTRTFDWPPERWEEYLKKYPEAKQFRNKPLANAEELVALFSGAVATGAYNWSSGMEGIPEMGNLSSMLSETPINVEDNDCEVKTPDSYTNVDEPLSDDMQRCKKKQKKSKSDETREDINKLVAVLEKTDDKGPSITQCMPILRKLLTYDNPMYYVATNALCNKREYRELWMGMECDEERIGWIYSLPKGP
ncbi:L10-interacting MYB domain-containing protein [Citrus sinensis]|nr:L10-interacting MYB domain-containing protein [Citrus sinensis]